MGKRNLLLGIIVMLVMAGAFVLQFQKLQRLQSENAALRERLLALGAEKQNASASAADSPIDASELQRLRSNNSELLRLRGEAGQLRQQLKDLSSRASTVRSNSQPQQSIGSQTNLPYQSFTALTRATLRWNETLVSGAWNIHPGKRVLVFLTPSSVNDANAPAQAPRQLRLSGKLAEVPEAMLSQIGLDELKATGNQTSAQAILSDADLRYVISTLEQTPGNDLMVLPLVTTLDGRQVQQKVVDVKPPAFRRHLRAGHHFRCHSARLPRRPFR